MTGGISMKTGKTLAFLILVLVTAAFLVPSTAEEPGAESSFSFRSGVIFGMSKEQLVRTESENGEVGEQEWEYAEMDNLQGLISSKPVRVSDYETPVVYILFEDRMQLAGYDFTEGTEIMFDEIRAALDAVYGEGKSIAAGDVCSFMNSVVPDSYSESDVLSPFAWETDNVTIYLYCFGGTDHFMILYTNPFFDYARSSEPAAVNTTGL